MWDDKTFKGVTVGRGAQIVNGCVNNPMALMCEQVGSLQRSCIIASEKLSGGWVGAGGLFRDVIKTPFCPVSKLCVAMVSLLTAGAIGGLQNGFRHIM